MDRELLQRAEKFHKKRHRKSGWLRVTGILGCVVFFCVTYALLLPAITEKKTTFCGKEEHVHEDSCYVKVETEAAGEVLICGLEETDHVHTDACYELQGGHAHTDACFVSNRGELTCAVPEEAGHAHGDGCYTQGNLLCAEEEGHLHTETCFTDEVLTCTEPEGHAHDAACYEQILTCTLAESDGHTHEDACYQVITTLTCDLEEAPGEQILICTEEGISAEAETEPHVHDETCYAAPEADELTCQLPEDESHTHGDRCYGIWALTCELEEHTHDLSCASDPSADLETAADWEKTFADVELTGVWADDVLAIAETQLGYHESTANYVVDTDEEDKETTRGYTRYGAWYGDHYGDWCAMFASFCLHYAGADRDFFPIDCNCENWIAQLSREEFDLYRPADTYVPNPGDLIFFDWEQDGEADHVGFVKELTTEIELRDDVEVEITTVHTLEGNTADQVRYEEYEITDSDICGYADLAPAYEAYQKTQPGYYSCGFEEHTHAEDCFDESGELVCELEAHTHTETCLSDPNAEPTDPDAIVLEPEYRYEDDTLAMTVHVSGAAYLPEGAAQADAEPVPDEELPAESQEELETAALPQLTVTPVTEDDAEYAAMTASLEENGMADDMVDLTALKLGFTLEEQPLDLTDCEITVAITPKEPILAAANYALAEMQAEAVADTDFGVEIAMLQQTSDEELTQLDAVYLENNAEQPAVMTLSAPLTNDGVLAVATSQTANPKFTVQYYAYLDKIQLYNEETSDRLMVINTDNGGTNSNGNLPKNGVANNLSYLQLNSAKQPETASILTETYRSHNYEYILAPNMAYFNRLYENGNYDLIELWILEDGADPASIDKNDWTVYKDVSDLHFTNRPQSAVNGTILIEDGTVIRMVYKTSTSDFSNGVTFYDYDTTNGRIYANATNAANETYPLSSAAAGGTYYAKTDNSTSSDQQGINDKSNYSSTGSKLAFGNRNTRVGLENVSWNGNTLNKYNEVNRPYSKGTTFGLVTHLVDGKIQYASGVSAPNLFNDGDAIGKTQIDGYTLVFDRVGDTYTLSSVLNDNQTAVESNLDVLDGTPWSNDFWPMDSVYDYKNNYVQYHDMKTGGTDTTTIAVGAPNYAYSGNSTTEEFPASDNGIAHNNYFGMNFSVNFTLTEDYVGPLEYLFFGDDDMWVFLDGELVCDIGGVHSSVGEYVNLWDWVEKGSNGTHTLSFFYTERGASGSSCYMHFTLPSVASITPERNTGNLKVEKLVVGADTETEFSFDIQFKDANGNPMRDDYAYTRYDANGNILMQDIIISDGGTFQLRDNEYVIVKYLPIGTVYTIREDEDSSAGYLVSIEATGGTSSGTSVTGTVIEGTVGAGFNTVSYTNSWFYELPETGGMGTTLFYVLGGILVAAAVVLLVTKKRMRNDS